MKYGLYYIVLLLALVAVFVQRREVPRALPIVLGSVWVATLTQGDRQDMLYINYLDTPWYLLLAWLLFRFLPARRWWTGLLVGLFLVQYLFGWLDSFNYVYPIQTFRGTYVSNSPQEAAFFNALYRRAQVLTPPGTYTLAYPYAPSFYFLTGARNVGRPPTVLPVDYPESIIGPIVARLDEVKPPFIYRFHITPRTLSANPEVDPAHFFEILGRWDQALLRDYEPLEELGAVRIYRRKPAEGTDTGGSNG